MKRLMFLLVVVVLLLVTLSACVNQNEASKYCKANNDFGLTHGKCVSYFTSASSIAEFCQEKWETIERSRTRAIASRRSTPRICPSTHDVV